MTAYLLKIIGIHGYVEIFMEQTPMIRVTRIITIMVFVSIATLASLIFRVEPTTSIGTITSVNFAIVAARSVLVQIKMTVTVALETIKRMIMDPIQIL